MYLQGRKPESMNLRENCDLGKKNGNLQKK
jgi:hypothetical protein